MTISSNCCSFASRIARRKSPGLSWFSLSVTSVSSNSRFSLPISSCTKIESLFKHRTVKLFFGTWAGTALVRAMKIVSVNPKHCGRCIFCSVQKGPRVRQSDSQFDCPLLLGEPRRISVPMLHGLECTEPVPGERQREVGDHHPAAAVQAMFADHVPPDLGDEAKRRGPTVSVGVPLEKPKDLGIPIVPKEKSIIRVDADQQNASREPSKSCPHLFLPFSLQASTRRPTLHPPRP